MFGDDSFSTAVEVAATAVIAQPGPVLQNIIERGRGECRQVRETLQETLVIRNNGIDLRLLQHDFRNPDAIAVAALLPGQIMAASLIMPAEQGCGKPVACR